MLAFVTAKTCPGLSPKCFKCKIHQKQKHCCTIAHIFPHKNMCRNVRNCHVNCTNRLWAQVQKVNTGKAKFSFASKCVTKYYTFICEHGLRWSFYGQTNVTPDVVPKLEQYCIYHDKGDVTVLAWSACFHVCN
jgi:hypothetical protein